MGSPVSRAQGWDSNLNSPLVPSSLALCPNFSLSEMNASISAAHTTKWQHIKSTSIVKALGFPVVMYGCESQTIKKAEYQRIDAFFFFFN